MNILGKFGIKDRVAIVTGGGQGIGKEIASIFAEAGAYVVISDRIAETVQATAQELCDRGGNVLATVTDVRDSGQVT
jgi:NAD(P)-dependent dehydrogenase (short-subunit alcohol dehydrogenase family)